MAKGNSRENDVERIFSRLRDEFQKSGDRGGPRPGLDWYPEEEITLDEQKLEELHALRNVLGTLSKSQDPRIGVDLFSTRPVIGRLIVLLKRVVRRIMKPYSNMILSRQAAFNAALLHLLDQIVEKWMANRSAIGSVDEQLIELREAHNTLIDGMLADIQSIKQRISEHAAKTDTVYYESLALKRDLEKILKGAGGVSGVSATSGADVSAPRESIDEGAYYLFEEFHREDSESLVEKQAEYFEFFAGKDNLLDVGCGRGEFLAFLKQRGIEARGVDSNRVMVESCRQKDLDVECADLIDYLAGIEDGTFGGIFCSQVVEHLPAEKIAAFIKLAWSKLRPGGTIVVETLNPLSLAGMTDHFYRDFTHKSPVHPETLAFLAESGGFKNVRIKYKSPPDSERLLHKLDSVGASDEDRSKCEVLNENIEKLNSMLFGFQEYAVIAEK